MTKDKSSMYSRIILAIFQRHYAPEMTSFEFNRSEIQEVANNLNIKLPKNYGDLIYSFRFRKQLPQEILDTSPDGLEWIIELAGSATYRFILSMINRIIPCTNLIKIKIPDATPEIIKKYTLGDEQALLTKMRYNRLIDIFLGITTYSLQNHLRTTVKGIGQIEIDEIYVGLNSKGTQFVIPVQAKSKNDQIGVVQTKQDIAYCEIQFPDLIYRPIAAQFLEIDLIAMFELTLEEKEIKVVQEKHYQLVSNDKISQQDLQRYQVYEE